MDVDAATAAILARFVLFMGGIAARRVNWRGNWQYVAINPICHNSTSRTTLDHYSMHGTGCEQSLCRRWPMDQALFASLIAVIATRATERILLVLIGALAIYLGYRLFTNIPNAVKGSESEGKIELPGGVSIFLTRIGPGVFFALFGIAVIGYSVTKPVEFNFPAAATTVAGGSVSYSGLAQPRTRPAQWPSASIAGPEPEIVVARLNGFYQEATKRLSAPAASELADAIRAAKFAVMLGRWKPEWGDRAAFERWVREHGGQDPPPHIAPGASVVFATVLQ